MKAAEQFGWSKAELISSIMAKVYEEICITDTDEDIDQKETEIAPQTVKVDALHNKIREIEWKIRERWLLRRSSIRRRWLYFGQHFLRWVLLDAVFLSVLQEIVSYFLINSCGIKFVVL